MTHFELFYELSREHLISIWELPLYSMKFFSRPMNVGICTLFIKCMCVYFNFFGMYEGPQNIQIQIQGRSAAACYIKSKLRNEVGIFGVRNIRDIFDIKRHSWDMWLETGGQSTKVCWPEVLMTARPFTAKGILPDMPFEYL